MAVFKKLKEFTFLECVNYLNGVMADSSNVLNEESVELIKSLVEYLRTQGDPKIDLRTLDVIAYHRKIPLLLAHKYIAGESTDHISTNRDDTMRTIYEPALRLIMRHHKLSMMHISYAVTTKYLSVLTATEESMKGFKLIIGGDTSSDADYNFSMHTRIQLDVERINAHIQTECA